MFTKSYHPEYYRLNSGVHIKPSSMFGVPALSHHLAYWHPKPHGNNPDSANNRKTWMNVIDERLFNIFIKLKLQEIIPHQELWSNADKNNKLYLFNSVYSSIINKKDNTYKKEAIYTIETGNTAPVNNDEPDGYQTILFTFPWHGMSTTLRSELYPEFFTMSIVIDLSVPNKGGDTKISEEIKNKLNLLEKSINSTEKDIPVLTAIHKYLYVDIWEIFHDEILCPKKNEDKAIGFIFADFRGLLVGSGINETSASADPKESKPFQYSIFDKDNNLLFRKPFIKEYDINKAPENPPKSTNDATKISERDAKNVIAKMWPFLTSDDSNNSIKLKWQEFTSCLMGNRRMIFATAMGPQPHEKKEHTPIFGLHYWNTDNPWQIGRMIDRLHYTGTLRLAAIMEIDKIKNYGNVFRDAETNINHARKELSKAHSKTPVKFLDETQEKEQSQAIYFLEEAQKKLNKDNTDCGIRYRINKSRFYVKQFKYTVNALHIVNIKGYQPYDGFIFRKMGALFDLIDSHGIRHDQIQIELANLVQLFINKTSLEIQRKISERNELMSNLQITGEGFLFLAIAPYYISHIIENMAHIFWESKNNNPIPIIWICVLMLSWFCFYLKNKETLINLYKDNQKTVETISRFFISIKEIVRKLLTNGVNLLRRNS